MRAVERLRWMARKLCGAEGGFLCASAVHRKKSRVVRFGDFESADNMIVLDGGFFEAIAKRGQ